MDSNHTINDTINILQYDCLFWKVITINKHCNACIPAPTFPSSLARTSPPIRDALLVTWFAVECSPMPIVSFGVHFVEALCKPVLATTWSIYMEPFSRFFNPKRIKVWKNKNTTGTVVVWRVDVRINKSRYSKWIGESTLTLLFFLSLLTYTVHWTPLWLLLETHTSETRSWEPLDHLHQQPHMTFYRT